MWNFMGNCSLILNWSSELILGSSAFIPTRSLFEQELFLEVGCLIVPLISSPFQLLQRNATQPLWWCIQKDLSTVKKKLYKGVVFNSIFILASTMQHAQQLLELLSSVSSYSGSWGSSALCRLSPLSSMLFLQSLKKDRVWLIHFRSYGFVFHLPPPNYCLSFSSYHVWTFTKWFIIRIPPKKLSHEPHLSV